MRTVVLLLTLDTKHANMLSVIPSTYNICRMYDNNSVQFLVDIDKDEDDTPIIVPEEIRIRFISGNIDVGTVVVNPTTEDEVSYYLYKLSSYYTQNSELSIQVIVKTSESDEIRTNIIPFRLSNSLPQDDEYYQNLSYLNRLFYDGKIVLSCDPDEETLVIYDDLGNELCSIDIDYMLGGDEHED